ncbi:MAG: hypothetical protein IJF07_05070 [Lachnospiraceae bacterium]|nr:hypothetical protein [Lachnospiraceae bacterium]
MGRKNDIEGQLSLFDTVFSEMSTKEAASETARETTKEDTGEALEEITRQSVSKECAKEDLEHRRIGEKLTPGGFQECKVCWCFTCEHSTVGGGKVRQFADRECVCPSCEICIQEQAADICVIGSAKEGCRYRAEKEGLVEPFL